jgi:hypothetical protein
MTLAFSPDQNDEPDGGAGRRVERRQRVLFGGKLVLGPNFSMDCTIRNLSDGGAQVRIAPEVTLPAEFHLIEIRSGVAYRAQIAWRSVTAAGLQFSERLDLTRPGLAPAYLRQLWLGCGMRGAHLHEDM